MPDVAASASTEISELLARYARGVDTKDWSLWQSIFTDDAYIDFAPGITGRPEVVGAKLQASLDTMRMTLHYVTNIEVAVVDTQRATARALFFAVVKFPGSNQLGLSGGRYEHQLTSTESGWRSVHFVVNTDWFHLLSSTQ
jgi:3-phenylpropionate/cinnamic acid dioxygenase small subunit